MSGSESIYVPQPGERVLFITGRLAESATRRVVSRLSERMGFDATVHVVGISVAALMHANWLQRKLSLDVTSFDHVYVPGWCGGELQPLTERFGIPFSRGPKDILDLEATFTQAHRQQPELLSYDIEILAEINHASRMSLPEILRIADRYQTDGADVIDLGCVPGEAWEGVEAAVAALIRAGHRVSIDSFERDEVAAAIGAGAELVLSCNRGNAEWLATQDVEVVVIPDDPRDLSSLEPTLRILKGGECRFRIDPILEPIGFGFAASLARYYEVRRRYPEQPMMIGIGNLTEMTDVDSAGLNVLFAALCQELNILSVLTTEVIPWSQTSVQEFSIARRLMKYAVTEQTLPKHVCDDLIMLRDPQPSAFTKADLVELARGLRDPNFRIFVEHGEIHVMNRDGYWRGKDAYELFDALVESDSELSPSHAFYLGYELSKAVTALTLNKRYRQDRTLRWGFLTVPEQSAHERRRNVRNSQVEPRREAE